ncbi:hypothetical protein COT97_04300 [Candidatus Falkowbacteria bacterium CG10_big_fil_rev_8_21_14_0_10_39_11]|uniref:Uncharacterized protein n=1 Tax=Candidatus Falkowbacteria bacterium CG10_big_fil_rev_8_21_14_0_10_39_11 TaxID=1974565 RepID=A0A2H0V486_9BACT|nr:MAG: hypothetical protein COT97_04300 [Candidatus Falkowbacteria bacterium CG10_big_fil_rev_8_21_14_0_10_39_11]
MGKKLIFIIVLVVVVLGGYWAYQDYYLSNKIKDLSELPGCDYYLDRYPDASEIIREACEYESNLSDDVPTEEDPGRVTYLNAALTWKSAADVLPLEQREELNRRAVDVYRYYENKFDDHAYALRWNIAHLYQDLGEYELAEEYYLKAIESNNVSSEPYVALYYLYENGDIEKSVEEVDAFFQKAFDFVSDNPDIILDRYLDFLEKNGLDSRAAEVRAELRTRYPNRY